MKKIITILAATIIAATSFGQALEKGSIVIDGYYGYVGPGLILRSIDALSADSKVSVIGPVGARVQYMVSSKFGIGLDVNYETKKGEWGYDVSTWNSTTSQNDITNYTAKYQVTKIKAMIRTSWEFVNTDKFTMNWANSIGYKAGARSLTTTESADANNSGLDLTGFSTVSPVAFRTALGMRFFFTENIGMNFETGLGGGGWILGGISFKL